MSEAFEDYPYKDFKALLLSIGVKDIRDAYISFTRPVITIKEARQASLNEDEEAML